MKVQELLKLNEYRMTRASLYPSDCPLSGRQGHYIRGASENDAQAEMASRYPGEWFTCQLWQQGR